jgi:hypothetical protein
MDYNLDQACAVLERTPRVLQSLLSGLPPGWTTCNEGPATWSPFDVIGHLIDGEETDWIPRARIILEHGEARPFTPFDRFRHARLNHGRPLEELLERFASQRFSNLAALRGWHLTPADLARTGIHPELGRVTLAQHLATWVAHDLDHIGQTVRVMAKQYAQAAGPWRAYLRVLQ